MLMLGRRWVAAWPVRRHLSRALWQCKAIVDCGAWMRKRVSFTCAQPDPLTDKPRQSDQGGGSEAHLEEMSSKVMTGHPVVGATAEGNNVFKLPLKRLTCSRMLQAHDAITARLATVHKVPVVRPARPSGRPGCCSVAPIRWC